MAMHSIIEINHDQAYKMQDDRLFGITLYHLLAHAYPPNIADKMKRVYGIKIIDQHHSSADTADAPKDVDQKAEEDLKALAEITKKLYHLASSNMTPKVVQAAGRAQHAIVKRMQDDKQFINLVSEGGR